MGGRGKAVEVLVKLVRHAKKNGLKVTFFLMESSRAHLELLRDLIVPGGEEGQADGVGIVDTRGCAYPPACTWLVAQVKVGIATQLMEEKGMSRGWVAPSFRRAAPPRATRDSTGVGGK